MSMTCVCQELTHNDNPTQELLEHLREDDFLESIVDAEPALDDEQVNAVDDGFDVAPAVAAVAVRPPRGVPALVINEQGWFVELPDEYLGENLAALLSSLTRSLEHMAFHAMMSFSLTVLPVMIGRLALLVLGYAVAIDAETILKKLVELEVLASSARILKDLDAKPFLLNTIEHSLGMACVLTTAATIALVLFVKNFSYRRVERIARFIAASVHSVVSFTRSAIRLSSVIVLLGWGAPFVVGCLIDIATLKSFNTTLPERCAMCMDRIVLCTMAHWVIGFGALVMLLRFFSEIKQLVRPNILPNNILTHDDDEIDRFLRFSFIQMIETAFLYLGLSVVFVFLCILLPFQYGHYIVPFSKRIVIDNIATAFEQIPIEMLVFHFLIPMLLEWTQNRNFLKELIRYFLVNMCVALHIDDTVLLNEVSNHDLLVALQDHEVVAARVERENEFAFHSDHARLLELQSVKLELDQIAVLTERIRCIAAADGNLAISNAHMIMHVCAKAFWGARKCQLIAQLDALKLTRLMRFRDNLSSIRDRKEVYSKAGRHTVNHQILRMLQTGFLKLQNELQTCSEKVDLLDEMDVRIRAEPTVMDSSGADGADGSVERVAPPVAAVKSGTTDVVEMINVVFADFLKLSGHEYLLLLPPHGAHDDSASQEEVVRSVLRSIVDHAIDRSSDDPLTAASPYPPRKVFTLIEMMDFLARHEAASAQNSSLVEADEQLLARVATVDEILAGNASTSHFDASSTPVRSAAVSHVSRIPVALRYAALVTTSMLTVSVLSAISIHVPIIFGRFFFALVGMSDKFLIYNFVIGLAIIYVCFASVLYISGSVGEMIGNANAMALLTSISRLLIIGLKVCIVCAVWLFIIPCFLGALVELLFFIPIGVALNETPVISPTEAWGSGVVFLKMWCKGVLVGIIGGNDWRVRLERVLNLGFQRIDIQYIFQEIISPVAILVMDLLAFPYTTGKLFSLFSESYSTRSLIMRYSFITFLSLVVAFHAAFYMAKLVKHMHDEFRDSRYLLGTNLTNR